MDDTSLGRSFEFGHFALYPEVGQLHLRGTRLKACHPQQVAFLATLLETPGVMVSKKKIKSRLWPNEIPTKNRLNTLASALWTLLGDENADERKYFVSSGRVGYCFICPVKCVEQAENTQINLAEQAYRAGKHRFDNRQKSSLLEAISWFEKALDRNPSHALAWVGLADAYIMLAIHCVEAPGIAFGKARAAAQSAIRIKPGMPEALVSLSWIELCYDRNWPAAQVGFRVSLQKKPSYSFAHLGSSLLQLATGRADDNIASIKKARKLSPLTPPLDALLCHRLYFSRRYSDAEEAGLKAIRTNPESWIAHEYLARVLLQRGRHETDVLHHFEEARRLSKDSKMCFGFWAHACAQLGRPEEARRALKELLSLPSHEYMPSYFVALIHLGLHQVDECIRWFDRACDERSHWVLFLNSDPIFDEIRSSESFQRLLHKVGFNSSHR